MKTPPEAYTILILRKGLLSPEQLRDAVELHIARGISLQEAIVWMGYATPEELLRSLAEYHGIPFIDLSTTAIPPSVIELIPESVARENILLPLKQEYGVLTVVVSDPADYDLVQKLQFILNKDIRFALAPRGQLIEAINWYYGKTETESVDSMLGEFTDTQIDFTTSEFELTLDASSECEDGGSEFELTLDDAGALSPDESGDKDVFQTEFEVPSLEEESGSEAVALDSNDTDLESSDFDEAMSGDASATIAPGAGRRVSISALEEAASIPDVERERKSFEKRHATVRYYHRMNPEKTFPLLVVLSQQKIKEIVQRGVSQKVGKSFKVAQGSVVEVEPILPGCTCYPPREQVRVGAGDAAVRFWVVPHVLGTVQQARVVVRQNGEVLTEVPLEARVVKQTMTILAASMALLLPLAAALLQHFRIDFRTQAEQDFSLYREVAAVVLGSFSPDVIALTLLCLTGCLYLWLRPRKRDLFWEITPAAAAPRPAAEARRHEQNGTASTIDQAVEHLSRLLENQTAWLNEAARRYNGGDFRGALAVYETVLANGKAPAIAYARGALAAGQLGQNARALAILKKAVEKLPASEITGAMWFNMGCFAARLGMQNEAMRYLGRAVDAGYTNLGKYRSDPDLAPLRRRPDFKSLVACIDS